MSGSSRLTSRRRVWVLWGALALASVGTTGCDDTPEHPLLIDLEDHQAPLTDQPGDDLFTMELFETDGDYPLDQLIVEINPYQGVTTTLENITFLEDQNGDDRFGVGDTLVVREGENDAYNESHAGTLFEVRLYADTGTGRTLLAERQWVGDGGLG